MIWHRFETRLRRTLRSEDGNMLVLGGFLLLGVLGFGGVALDFGQMVELRRKLQVAADVAAHEHVGGKAQPELQVLCRASVEDCTVEVKSSLPDVSILACAPYQPLLGPVYVSLGVTYAGLRVENGRLQLCAASEARGGVCSLPNPAEEMATENKTEACPAGQTGEITYELERTRTASCAEGATSHTWSDWVEKRRNQVSTCKAAPPQCRDTSREPRYRWSASREKACPTGATFGQSFYRVKQVSWPSCDAYNDEGWTDWADVTPEVRSGETSTCSTTCLNGNDTRWQEDRQPKAVYCPSTQQMEDIKGVNLYGISYWCSNGVQGSTGWQSRNTWKYQEPDCPTGGKAYTAPGQHTWVVPDRVKRVSAIVVGGGGSGSVAGPTENTYIFTPGEASVVRTPNPVQANGGGSDAVRTGAYYNNPGKNGGCGGQKEGGDCGGLAGRTPIVWNGDQTWEHNNIKLVSGGGGGGAGGYYNDDGAGRGSAFEWNNDPQGGHSGGGGGGRHYKVIGTGGGGVGINSYADNGRWGQNGAVNGGGGSEGGASTYGSDVLPTDTRTVIAAPDGGSYGGGGGGVMGLTTRAWEKGYGGGGGELSYRNSQTVVPNGTLSVVVGAGGAAPEPITVKVGEQTYQVRPGSGAGGAARILWGLGCWNQERKFPAEHASENFYERCPWVSE